MNGDISNEPNHDAAGPPGGVGRFTTTRRVEFADTDAAGIAHFAAFFPWMESAEHAFLRHLGIAVLPPRSVSPRLTWPRVRATCDYRDPVRFGDELTLGVGVEHLGRSSVTYRIDVTNDGRSVATGRLVAVCCELNEDGLKRCDLPEDMRRVFEKHVVPAYVGSVDGG